ncbi:MAG: ABC transporter ATP-binding protein [Thermoplasmata archaeon]
MEIIAKSLTKIYDGKYKALDSVDLDINLNGIFSIIGKNGAGKTTLIRILSTQLMPTSGTAILNGHDILREAGKVREEIAAVPQEARAVPWLTPIQTVTSYLMWRGYTFSKAKQMGLDALRSMGLEDLENQKNRKLSGGQKRKLMVATVIASEASIIFLDEPTTGLDYISRKELWEILRKLKKDRLIILTTHYLEEAEVLGDLITILDKGKIMDSGTIGDLRSKIKYPFVLKVYSPLFDIEMKYGKISRVSDNEFFIYGSESEIYSLVQDMINRKVRFTVEEVSLSNIFENLVGGGEED